MADEFKYSAELELDAATFIRSLQEAEKSSNRLKQAAGALDTELGQKLLRNIDRVVSRGHALEASFKKGGAEAKSAAMALKTYNGMLERTNRRTADFLGKGSPTARKGMMTFAEKDEAAGLREEQKLRAAIDRAHGQAIAENRRREDAAHRAKITSMKEEQRMIALHSRALRENAKFDQDKAYSTYGPNIIAAQNAEKAAVAQEQYVESLSNTRYALYDLATTMVMVSAATLGLSGAAVGVAATFEREFADVQRTSEGSQEQINALRQSLVDLTTQMPTDFTDVAGIATLGGQLGIATENIDEFTRTVTMFASTTDVSVDAAAEGFGRLAQLTKTPQDEISNLGAAIYQTGVTSVATESAILNVGQQIAVSGQLAGFSADEIIGLSAALASLGVAPEAARGSFMRIFSNITTAVDEGGASLDQFASAANMSASEFASAWKETPQQAFSALIEGFSQAADSGQNLTGILKDLGIGAVRDQRALLLLADNTEVYNQALNDSTEAYAQNTALQEGYGVVAETLSAKLQVFLQTLQAIIADGLTPMLSFLSPIMDRLQDLAGIFQAVAASPIGGVIISITAGLAGFVGIIALVVAGATSLFAALASAITGLNGWIDGTKRAENGTQRLNVALMGTVRSLQAMAVQTRAGAAAWTGYGTSVGVARTMMGHLGTAVKGVGTVLKTSLPLVALGAAFWALDKAIGAVAETIRGASGRADEIFGGSDGLAAAIEKDTQAMHDGADVYRTYTAEIETSRQSLTPWASGLGEAVGAQVSLNDATGQTTDSIREQTQALGENVQAYLANQLANNEDFQNFYKNHAEALESAGADLQEALRRSMEQEGGGAAYFDELINKVNELSAAATEASMDMSLTPDQRSAAAEQVMLYNEQVQALSAARREFAAVDAHLNGSISNTQAAAAANAAFGLELDTTAAAAGELGEEMTNLGDGLFDNINAVADMSDALYGLHESLAENGNSFDVYTEEGRANMDALQRSVEAMANMAGGDMAMFGQGLANIFAHLESAGAAASPEIDFLRQQLVNTFNQQYGLDLDISDAMGSIQSFINAAMNALETRAMLERSAFVQAQARSYKQESRFRHLAGELGKTFGTVGTKTQEFREQKWEDTDQYRSYQQQKQALEDLKVSTAEAGQEGKKAGQAIQRGMDSGAGGAKRAEKATKNAAKSAKEAQEEIYSLVDYAGDLGSIWDRAFDIRFGSQMAKDDTAGLLDGMRESARKAAIAIRDARQSIRELRADLKSLSADRKIMQYQLGVAIEYGDDLRAAELRAELAQNSADAADKSNDLKDAQKDLKDAQKDASKELSGNSVEARRNRSEVLKLVQSYQQEIMALASSGASKATLQRRTQELRNEFIRQLTQMGYNRKEVNKYARSFTDLSTIIRKVPRKINVRANTNPATQALNEWLRRNKNRRINMRANVTGLPRNVSGGTYRPKSVRVGSGGVSTPAMNVRGKKPVYELRLSVQDRKRIASFGNVVGKWSTGGPVGYHATGGVHGMHPGRPKGTDTTPAWLTPGEFVQRKKAVDHYGLPFMNAINSMKFPKYMATGGGVAPTAPSGGSGIQVVELLPHQLRAIVNSLKVDLNIGSQQVAAAANAGNSRQAGRGAN